MEITLKKDEIKWIENNYPELHYVNDDNIIKGELNFIREYNDKKISDSYEIEIRLVTKENSILPQVREVGGKIGTIAQKYNKKIRDLHVNDDGTLCLTIYEKEKEYLPNGFEARTFFKKILEHYLYWVSYYDKFGGPPWPAYAHGKLAYLELYAENKIDLKRLKEEISIKDLSKYKGMKGHQNCLCESGKKLRNCHNLIYQAIYKLKQEL